MFTNRPAVNNRPSAKTKDPFQSLASLETLGGIPADVYQIRDRVQKKLLSETEGEISIEHLPQMRQTIEALFNQVLVDENLIYTRANRGILLEWVIADILGYGPLEPLFQDNTITEVMVNGYNEVYIERNGIIERTNVKFENNSHVMRILDRIVSHLTF